MSMGPKRSNGVAGKKPDHLFTRLCLHRQRRFLNHRLRSADTPPVTVDPEQPRDELPFADTPHRRRTRKRAKVEEFDSADEDVVTDHLAPVFVDGIPTYPELTEPLPPSDNELLSLSETNRQQLLALLEQERLASIERRTLHARIDFVHGQGASDATTVDQLDYLLAKERLLSVRRRTLHRQIDHLRGKPTER